MKTINSLLDEIKKSNGLGSERRLALHMGWSESHLRHYRKRRSAPADRPCIQIADALGVHPGYVLALAYFQRERNPAVRKVWLNMARFFEHVPMPPELVSLCRSVT